MSEFRVDVGYFKMVTEFYDKKCPCWGGKYACPCPPFVENKNCRCGAVRALDDPKAQKTRFKIYKIDFSILAEIIKNGYECPEEEGQVCFCKEFLESGECRLNVFKKIGNVV